MSALLSLLFFLWSFLFSHSVEVWTLDQSLIQGEIESIDASHLNLRVDQSIRKLPIQEIFLVKWAGSETSNRAPEIVLDLVNGDRLYSKSVQAGKREDLLRIETDLAGSLELPIENVRQIFFPKEIGSQEWSSFTHESSKDRLYRKTQNGFDFLNGTVEGFDEKQLLFRSSLGIQKFSLEEIAALVLAPIDVPEKNKELLAVIDSVGGSRWSGKLVGIRPDSLELQSPLLGQLSLNSKQIATLSFQNGRYVFLSDLEPSAVEEATPFGGDSIAFPYRKDRSVSGKTLRVGGVEYRRGLGVHSRCVLKYALDKKYRSFRASIGIDDEVLDLQARGSVIFRVWVDGKKLYESPVIRGGTGVTRIPDLSLEAASELRLEVDYADQLHVADRADWLNPLLIK